jgi:hypothetical protein
MWIVLDWVFKPAVEGDARAMTFQADEEGP